MYGDKLFITYTGNSPALPDGLEQLAQRYDVKGLPGKGQRILLKRGTYVIGPVHIDVKDRVALAHFCMDCREQIPALRNLGIISPVKDENLWDKACDWYHKMTGRI